MKNRTKKKKKKLNTRKWFSILLEWILQDVIVSFASSSYRCYWCLHLCSFINILKVSKSLPLTISYVGGWKTERERERLGVLGYWYEELCEMRKNENLVKKTLNCLALEIPKCTQDIFLTKTNNLNMHNLKNNYLEKISCISSRDLPFVSGMQ